VTKTTPRALNYSKFSVPFKTSEIKHAYVQNEYGIFEPKVIEQEKDSIVIGIHITEIPDSIVLKLYECVSNNKTITMIHMIHDSFRLTINSLFIIFCLTFNCNIYI